MNYVCMYICIYKNQKAKNKMCLNEFSIWIEIYRYIDINASKTFL